LSEAFLISVGHVYVAFADRCHFIHDGSEHYIVGYMQPFSFGFGKYGCELFDSSFHSWLLRLAMQLVQLFEPDMSQVCIF